MRGNVLSYKVYKDKIEGYKWHGLRQLVSTYKAHYQRFIPVEELKWGEEMEYMIFVLVQCQDGKLRLMLSSRGPEIIDKFNTSEAAVGSGVVLMPEFGSWMVEAVPTEPYSSLIDPEILLSCEEKIIFRRKVMEEFCKQFNITPVSMTNVMHLGTPNAIYLEDEGLRAYVSENMGKLEDINNYTQSKFAIDKTINPHPRFGNLAQCIRERRGEKVEITVPLFEDKHTNMHEVSEQEPYPGKIYMDAMPFGMGQCCLQITYECSTMRHGTYLHDQLMSFSGILAALSAAGPIQKSKLSDNDLRWTVIEQSVDCRTKDERDPNNELYIPKSRYSSMNHYLSDHEFVQESHFNNPQIRYSEEYFQFLKKECPGINDRLARHFARIFTRDPIPMYEGELVDEQIDDESMSLHFENLQSTNWNSMRFKPPPSQTSNVGWRVEFRTLDIQLTDFENSCLIILVGLLVNVINHFNLDFILPLREADVNMERAHRRSAVLNQKFWFNRNFVQSEKFWECGLHQSDFLRSRTGADDRREP